MNAMPTPSLYRINLIRELREREYKDDRQRRLMLILSLGCFGFFLLSLIYSGLTIWRMESVLAQEKLKVEQLQQEYRKYTATRLIVDKSDIELLDRLQGRGVFWTKKLSSMAKHLPENYWITQFGFQNNELRISGFGNASPQQEQLLVLDQYLNRLRADSNFAVTFTKLQLNRAERLEATGKVAFEFSAYTSNWKAP